jgi:hypothetical protein
VLAAKEVYFGVSGSVFAFSEALLQRAPHLTFRTVHTIDDGPLCALDTIFNCFQLGCEHCAENLNRYNLYCSYVQGCGFNHFMEVFSPVVKTMVKSLKPRLKLDTT